MTEHMYNDPRDTELAQLRATVEELQADLEDVGKERDELMVDRDRIRGQLANMTPPSPTAPTGSAPAPSAEGKSAEEQAWEAYGERLKATGGNREQAGTAFVKALREGQVAAAIARGEVLPPGQAQRYGSLPGQRAG